jgi:peptidoglycan/LPS O-acetylase OafA/YrhL
MALNWNIISKYRTELMGVAIVWIILFHGNEIGMRFGPPFTILDSVFSFGNSGVDMFLFLSGVGLYSSYSQNRNVMTFYRRRARRVLWPYFIITIGYWIYVDFYQIHSAAQFVLDITQVSLWTENMQRIWYVGLVIPLYILFPLIFRLYFGGTARADASSGHKAAWLVIIMSVAINYLLQMAAEEWYSHLNIAVARIPIFLYGVLAGHYVAQSKNISSGEWMALLVGLALSAASLGSDVGFLFERLQLGVVALVVCAVCCLFFEHIKRRRAYAPIVRCLRFIGAYSFELYLTHICIRRIALDFGVDEFVLDNFGDDKGLLFYALVLILSVVATALFAQIEKLPGKIYVRLRTSAL